MTSNVVLERMRIQYVYICISIRTYIIDVHYISKFALYDICYMYVNRWYIYIFYSI